MLCYRDRCFCSRTDCENESCFLRVTDKIVEAAERIGLPIDMADFSKGLNCFKKNEEI